MDFQDVILTLSRYWGEKRCVLVQPHDAMMGAGTFHPATVLRSLGPAHWRCAYPQPSRRPGDARYGDNPNRLGHYYQYQVLLKPSPLDVQDLYLGSLQAIGIDLGAHDVRFVEDDWESPTLGAWGLGWEVWMNGMEVSQFTYFQQVGGIGCNPVPAELTYGLERLTMALQGVDNVYDLQWVDGVKYGDVFHRNEVEQSKYNFEHSDPEKLFELFNACFTESERLAELGLALPAYDQAIATSHTFNLLDARGAISVAERQQYIRRIRELACRCAAVWVEQTAADDRVWPGPSPVQATPASGTPTGTGELLCEIQCEELPAGMVRPALAGLEKGLLALLEGVEHGPVRTYATPRRLAVVVEGVAATTPVTTQLVTGPPAERAFDADGQPTKAALGFARGRGVDASALRVVDGPKGPVVAVEVTEGGERVADRLQAGIDAVVREVPFAKTMEWGHGGVRWARPIHRVNLLLDGVALSGVAADLPLGNTTVGHRLKGDAPFAFTDEASWLEGLRARGVEPDLAVREAAIRRMLVEAAERLGSDAIEDDELLEEVLHLVEAPSLVLGRFEPSLLELPPRLLVQSMKEHQRYFPVFRDGALTSDFVVISNNPWGDAERIADGNARVLLARFDDARFFLAEDRKRPLMSRMPELEKMRWIRGLGTMADKQARVAGLAEALAPFVGADATHAAQAGALSKLDLVTLMVGEFPSLQGHMGRLYAQGEGFPDAVAVAIEEAYFPRFADDGVAGSAEGAAVALAERLDTLVGCFGAGMKPKGGDPQGLRRAALGVVRTLVLRGHRVDLAELVGRAVDRFHAEATAGDGYPQWVKVQGAGEAPSERDALVAELVAFLTARWRAQAIADGTTGDLVDAVLEASAADPLVWDRKLAALVALAGDAEFVGIMETFKRVLNITRDEAAAWPSRDGLGDDAERALYDAITASEADIADAVGALDFERALAGMLTLRAPVAAFFDAVMVASDVPAERARRMGLLKHLGALFLSFADFSRISTR